MSHANNLATTLPPAEAQASSSGGGTGLLIRRSDPAVAPAFSSVSLSHSYLPLNRLSLLSSFLTLKYPYLTYTALLPHPPFLNHSPFFTRNLILSFLLLLPHLINSSSLATLIFILIIPQITSIPSFYLFSLLSTSINT